MRYNIPMARRTTIPGFTLVELLVVMAVIALLAAMLFPVFASARGAARKSVCLSNLRQLGMAVSLYSQDYDDFYPYGADPSDEYTSPAHLAGYIVFGGSVDHAPPEPEPV